MYGCFRPGFSGQLLSALIVSVSSFVSGTFLGWPSSAIPQITDGTAGFTLTDEQIAWMVALTPLGSFLSPIPCCHLIDKIGRRNTLILFDLLVLVSWSLLEFSSSTSSIYLSRFISGLWGGVSYTTVVIYVCEVTEPQHRGTLGAVGEMMLLCGSLFESVLAIFPYKTMIAISAVPPLLLLFGLMSVPESPYFYLMKGDRATASAIFKQLRGSCSEEEIDVIESSIREQLSNNGTYADIITSSVNSWAFFSVLCLKAASASTSLIFLMAYGSVVLPDSIISAKHSFTILSSIWVAAALFFSLIMDTLNRRTMLSISSVGASMSALFATAWYFLRDETTVDTGTWTWFPLFILSVTGVFEMCGMFNIPSVITGEIFAINVKSKSSALCCMAAFVIQSATYYFFYPITNNFGLYFNFLKIFITSALTIFVVKFMLVETRGKSLEEIQKILQINCKN